MLVWLRHVQSDGFDAEPLANERPRRCLALRAIAGAEENAHSGLGKLAADLEADAAIGAGDEGGRSRRPHGAPQPPTDLT